MKINPGIVFHREFDNTGLLFDPDNGKTFGLNRTSAFLFEQFAAGKDIDGAIEELKKCCSDVPENVRENVEAFAARLAAEGFLEQ